jgi:hypothetical protein
MAEVTPEQFATYRRLAEIFLPSTVRGIDRLYPAHEGSARFAHYTSADAALNIIRSKRLWLRNASCMSDYREVQYGYEILLALFGEKDRHEAFTSALDACAPGVAIEAIKAFDDRWPKIRRDTFIAALSEHPGGKEDLYGRLSMWRAVGTTGVRVALIVKIPHFAGAAQAMQLSFGPVTYAGQREVGDELNTVIKNVRDHDGFLHSLDPQMIRAMVFLMLLTDVICVKHEAFSEEAEWRAFHAPIWGDVPPQVPMMRGTESLNGVPQHVYYLPLDTTVSPLVASLDFAQIFDRLIIGPTQYPASVADVFIETLSAAGVQDAANKIQISWIPIRT